MASALLRRKPVRNNLSVSYERERGVALVIALVLLLVLTIIGVASMNSSLMQERMAGNVNLQTLAFEAASAGIVDSLDFLETGTWPACSAGDSWPPTAFGPFRELDGLPSAQPGPLPAGTRVGYQLRAGCFEDSVGSDGVTNSQLLVLSRGVVCRGAGCTGADLANANVLAVREVEVRVAPIGGDPECLLNIGPLAPGAIGAPSSGAHLVDGGPGGCPIRFAGGGDASDFSDALGGEPPGGKSRVGQWLPRPPGITSASPGSRGIWEDGVSLARAVNAVKVGVRAFLAWETGGHVDPNPFAECAGHLHVGPAGFPGPIPFQPDRFITYVAGNLDTAGMSKGTIRDSIVIVEGFLDISGTTPYQGADFIALGGEFNVSGWGKARNSGLIYLENLRDRGPFPSPRFAYSTNPPAPDGDGASLQPSTQFNISGMGNARIEPDECDDLQDRWRQLNACIGTLTNLVSNQSINGCDDGDGGLGPCESDFHYYIEEVMGFTAYRDRANIGSIGGFDVPDLEGSDVEFPIPGCGGAAGPGARNVIASWREYIDQARWP